MSTYYETKIIIYKLASQVALVLTDGNIDKGNYHGYLHNKENELFIRIIGRGSLISTTKTLARMTNGGKNQQQTSKQPACWWRGGGAC